MSFEMANLEADGVGRSHGGGAPEAEARADGGARTGGTLACGAATGDLTPPPLTAFERRMLVVLAALVDDGATLRAAVDRYAFLRAASGLGVGMDPSIVEGLRHAADGLEFLERRASARR